MSALTPSVTDATFKDEVLASETPVLVDFWAEWCGPCRQVAPILDEIAETSGEKLRIVKLNIDDNPRTTADYGVMAIPTMLVFQGGEVADRIVGAPPKRQLLNKLDKYI